MPEPARSTNADLWTVPVAAATPAPEPRNLTAVNKGWDGAPHYSPDGRFIAYRSQAVPGYESALYRLARVDRQGGEVALPDRPCRVRQLGDRPRLGPGRPPILFQADVAGAHTRSIGSAPRAAPRPAVLTDGTIDGLDGHSRRQGAWSTPAHQGGAAARVCTVPSRAGAEPEQLTHFNADLESEVDIRPGRGDVGAGRRRLQGPGLRHQAPRLRPDPKKYPLILNVHGGPQSPWQDRYRGDWQVYPGKGYVVAFPNPTGSTGFGQDFIDAISLRLGRPGVRRPDEGRPTPWPSSPTWIADRMGAMGWSYGGYMMMWFEGHTDRFQAIASMMGRL